MLNIAPFITPLAAHPDPNGAVGNALHARGLANSNANEKARLAEQANEFNQRQALDERQQGFNESTDARNFEQHRSELHTKLVDWGMQVLDKEGPEKAQQIVGPVWQAAGIGVDFGDNSAVPPDTGGNTPTQEGAPDEMAGLEAAQAKRGDLAEYQPGASETGPKPGESFTAYVSRNTSAKPSPVEKETPAEDAAEGGVEEPAGAPAATPSRQWRIFDQKTGRQLGVIDPDKLAAENQKRADERAAAYVSGTPDNRKGIIEGMTSAARTPEEVETGMKHGEFTFGQLEKTDRTIKNHKGGGAAVPAVDLGGAKDSKLLNQTNSQVRQYVTTAVNNSGVKQLNQKAQNAAQIADMVDSASSGAQRQAFATQLHANFGAASSEGERAFMLEQGGKVQALLAKVDAWVNSGQLPPGLKEEIHAVAQMQAEFAQRYAQGIREKATKDAMEAPNLGGQYDAAFGRKLSDDEKRKIGASVGNLGGVDGSDGAGGTPSSDADEEFNKLGI
jgi:hypothetical protein